MYITNPVWSHVLALRLWTLKKAHNYSLLPGSLRTDYKYLYARQIPHQLSFHSQTIPACIRYIIGVFCCNFKSQTKYGLLSKLRYSSPCSGINFTLLVHCAGSLMCIVNDCLHILFMNTKRTQPPNMNFITYSKAEI